VFKRNKTIEPTDLEELIKSHIATMRGMDEDTEEYIAAAQTLKTLMETRKVEHEIDLPWRPSADAVMAAAASLAGIVAILTFEKANVVTTKAVSFIPKIH
jgi:hypothetical protein